MNYTYDDFTRYYGGTPPECLREYAGGETDIERKQMFLRLARELEKGVIYTPGEGSQLSYQKIS